MNLEEAFVLIKTLEEHPDYVDWQIRTGDLENYDHDDGYSCYICIGRGANWKYAKTVPEAIGLAVEYAFGD